MYLGISVYNVDTVVTVGINDTLETVIRTCVTEDFTVKEFDVLEKVSNLELTDGDTITINLKVPICIETSRKLMGKTDIDVVNRLLDDPRVDPSADNNCAIRSAAKNGHLDVVNRLLEDPRVDPSSNNNCAIRWAAKNGHLDVVNRLLEDLRVDPSADNNFAIEFAAKNGHLDVVNRLLEDPRVDPSADDNYAIGWAVENGHLDVVNRLLEFQDRKL